MPLAQLHFNFEFTKCFRLSVAKFEKLLDYADIGTWINMVPFIRINFPLGQEVLPAVTMESINYFMVLILISPLISLVNLFLLLISLSNIFGIRLVFD